MLKFICIFALWIGWFGHQPIRGKSIAPSIFSMIDLNKSIDNMNSKMVYGVGFDDSTINSNPIAVSKWYGMFKRCYSKSYHKTHPTYIDCAVDEGWFLFSNFEKWFNDKENGYTEGYHLDKDILVKGNKVYSQDTCCFVPQEINSLFIKNDSKRGRLPIGVTKGQNGMFVAQVHFRSVLQYLGSYSSVEKAFNAYKKEKEVIIKILGDEYYKKGLITQKVYNALLNYNINISD